MLVLGLASIRPPRFDVRAGAEGPIAAYVTPYPRGRVPPTPPKWNRSPGKGTAASDVRGSGTGRRNRFWGFGVLDLKPHRPSALRRTVKTQFARMTTLFLAFLTVVLTPAASTQVIEVTGDVTKLPVSPNREDVKAIGMGRTQIANGYTLNGMLYNPAVLARSKTRIDILTLSGEVPKDTPDALALLRDDYEQFTTGQFLKDINAGAKELQDYFKGVPGADQSHALSLLNKGLDFTRQLQAKVLGTPEVPKVHGIGVIPAIQLQIGNFGFALYGNVQAGFQSTPTATTNRLYTLRLPANLEDLSADDIDNLLEIVGGLFDSQRT